MNIYKYLLIKRASNTWLSNADSTDNLVAEDSDLYKNLNNIDDNTYDPIMQGPIYQDVSPIYQEPKKYGIPEEVAMAEREHHDNEVNRWKQEYNDAIMPSILESMGAYSSPPSVSQLTNDLLSLHYGTYKPEPVSPLNKDKFLAGYQRMQVAPDALREEYERKMDYRNQLMMRRSVEQDPMIQDKLTKAIQRAEGNLGVLINQLNK